MIDYLIAIGWGLIGWVARVCWTYFTYSNKVESKANGRFSWKKFKKEYDQYWIMGFVAMIALALSSDLLWSYGLNKIVTDTNAEYEPRINIMIGYMSIYILEKISKR